MIFFAILQHLLSIFKAFTAKFFSVLIFISSLPSLEKPTSTGLAKIVEEESAESIVVDTEDPRDIVRYASYTVKFD